MARVLVSEPLAVRGIEAMQAAGFDVDVRPGLTPEELLDAVRGAAALVIRSATQVTAEVLEAGRDLVVVGRAGIGLDNVDVAEATRRGVMVVNAPQSNILSAAEHTLALLLAQARNVPQANADLRAGHWNRSRFEGVELHGKTLGIIGLGRVGVLVAQRANAFGMRLLAFDPFVSPERARQIGVGLTPTIEELFAASDFVSVHATKTPQTINLVNAAVLAHAKHKTRRAPRSRSRSCSRCGASSYRSPSTSRRPRLPKPCGRSSRSPKGSAASTPVFPVVHPARSSSPTKVRSPTTTAVCSRLRS
jgi:D-3-phosphoglycerate dehydrogenase